MKHLLRSLLPAIALAAAGLLLAPPRATAQTDCGPRYADMLRDADRAYAQQDYRGAYEKYRAARGCRNADAAHLDRRMDDAMAAIDRLRAQAVASEKAARAARDTADAAKAIAIYEQKKAQTAARAAELTARAIDIMAQPGPDKTLALRLVHEACSMTRNESLLPLKTRHNLLSDPANTFLARIFSGHASYVLSVAFSPDGKQVLTGSWDKTAKLWDLSGREIQTFSGHASSVWSVAFSPDGKQVLTGSDDKTAKLWDLSGREIQTFSGHASEVWSVAFSPDGKQVLTGSDDKTAKLWAVALEPNPQKQAAQTWQLNGACYAVAFSPSGERVVVGAGQHFFPYLCGLCNLGKQGYVAELSVQQRIENELMREEDCLAAQQAETLTGCAKYFLQKNATIEDYREMYFSYDEGNLRTALRLASKSAQLAPQGEGAVVEQDIRGILAQMEAGSVAVPQVPPEAVVAEAAPESDSLTNAQQLDSRLLDVQRLENQLNNNPADSTIAQRLASACANVAWSQLFTGDYAGVVKSVERGLQVAPQVTWGYTNLALGYLLGGNWPAAAQVYAAWKDRSWKTSGFDDVSQHTTFREAFLADLDDLERMGIRHADFAKARVLLKGE